jgi:hypothetical protein
MAEIESEHLTRQHRDKYHYIIAFDDNESVLLEDRKWVPPWMSADHPALETKFLYVRVQRCDEPTIQSLREKIGLRGH